MNNDCRAFWIVSMLTNCLPMLEQWSELTIFNKIRTNSWNLDEKEPRVISKYRNVLFSQQIRLVSSTKSLLALKSSSRRNCFNWNSCKIPTVFAGWCPADKSLSLSRLGPNNSISADLFIRRGKWPRSFTRDEPLKWYDLMECLQEPSRVKSSWLMQASGRFADASSVLTVTTTTTTRS